MSAESEDLLTLQEAADELKVHYMTAYRWVRRGDLEAFKTGGRLRIRRQALDDYVAARRVDTAAVTTRSGDSRRDWDAHVDTLTRLLIDGDSSGANAMVRKVVSDGATAGEVYTRLLTPSMHDIGERWAEGEVLVSVEHRATEICIGIMSRLAEQFRRRGPRRGTAVTMTLEGESHGVASAMIADFLRSAGWEVHHLGTGVPLDDLAQFLELVPADVVCVSAAAPVKPEVYTELAELCEDRRLVMGGRGADLALAEPRGIVVIEDPVELVEYLEEDR